MAGFAQTLDPRLLAQVPKSFRPLYRQAYGETLLRYAPQQQSLLGLLGQAEGGYQQKVAQANAAADLIQNAALTQQRNLPAAYQSPGSSNPLMGLLGQHAVQAAEAAKYQITGYQGQRDTDLGKINESLGDLGTNAATYFSTRADQLVQGDRKTRHDTNLANKRITADLKRADLSAETSRRGQDITVRGQDLSHEDRQASIDARRDAAAKKARKSQVLSKQAHTALQNTIASALVSVDRLKGVHSRRYIAQTLLSGRESQTITLGPGDQGYDPSNPAANKLKVPGLAKVPQLALTIALDRRFNPGGRISRANLARLHKAGYSIDQLGYPYASRRRGPSVTGGAIGSTGKGKGGF